LVTASGEGEAAEPQAEPEGIIEELQASLKAAEAAKIEAERQVRDYAERFRQAQARLRTETDELRLRLQRNAEQKIEAARGDLVATLLDVLDNLKRAVTAAEESEDRSQAFASLLGGVRVTAEMFEARMRQLGLAPIASQGEDFNPELHEAVEIVPVAPEQDNRVVEELQPGYRFGDRLLRPARVRVGRASD
jgi:molecular chaperone GrpE (heat shock protein)